jgi:hypothetical protein
MTAEQRLAFTTFRAAVAPLRLRVKTDAEGFPIAPGRYGQLEWYGEAGVCAVWTDRPRLFSRIWAVPGVRHHQTGDREMRAIVPIEGLGAVAAVIRARRRYSPSPAQLRNLVTPSTRATSRLQDARSGSGRGSGSPSPALDAVVTAIQGGDCS